MSDRFLTREELERRADREALRSIDATLKEMLALQQRQAGGIAKPPAPAKRLAKALAADGVVPLECDPVHARVDGTAEVSIRVGGSWSAVEEVVLAFKALRR